jgi:TIR domain
MANIFVSYSRESEAVAKILVQDFEELGHTVWFDEDLNGGQKWWDHILAKIRACDVLSMVMDKRSLSSVACVREYAYADALGKPILPILVADGISSSLLPPELSNIQYVDYRQRDAAAAIRLAKAFGTLPAAPALPDPLPTPPMAPISYLGGLAQQIESPSPLGYEQQAALVSDLRRSLRDPGSAHDAHELLAKLRRRRDLLATIAEDIDELLASTRSPKGARNAGSEDEVVVSKASFETEKRPSATLNAEQSSGQSLSENSRMIAAIVGCAAGAALGLLLVWYTEGHGGLALIPAAGGAIAGALAGTQERRLAGVCLGLVSGWIILAIVFRREPSPFAVGGVLGAPPGAILGALGAQLVGRRSRKQSERSPITNPQESD